MRKLLQLLIPVLLVLSCDSSPSGPENSYFIRAKFNGELKEFTNDVVGTFGRDNNNNQNIVHIVLNADQDPSHGFGGAFPGYDIELSNLDGNITTSTYSEADFSIQSRYVLDGFTRFSNFANDVDDFSITVKSISDTEISGTFSGTITKDNEDISITAGEFYVPIVD